ncbi:MAG: hypothetical protein Q8L53_03675 [Aestuariivirga sp.]|nr:hypothetical protein [Aestuariivirga sp.]
MSNPFRGFYYLLFFGVLLLGVVALMRVAYQVPIIFYTRDISVLSRLHPLAGSVSSLGAFVWGASASTCFFTVFVFRSLGFRYGYVFLLCSGLLSLYLMLDDFFVIHEALAPSYLGVQQMVVVGALVLIVLVYLIVFGRLILASNFVMLLAALSFFALSVVIDQSPLAGVLKSNIGDWEDFIEDGAKLLGILCWYAYFIDTSRWLLLNQERLAGHN